jgi:hypothetical protein
MSNESNLPPNGIYFIANEGTGKYFDLETGNVSPNTPIIGWGGHGLLNQQVAICIGTTMRTYAEILISGSQWVFEREGNICWIKSNLPGPHATMFITTAQHIEVSQIQNLFRRADCNK